MRAMVIGGGIGGLTAAIALRRAGVETVVFELARQLHEIGASITLWANAMRALRQLGLRAPVRALGWPPPGSDAETVVRHEIRSPSGKLLCEIPVGALDNALGEESVIMGRPDLQKALGEAFREAQGEMRLGSRFVDYKVASEEVIARFADGCEERADLLVGADGLRSVVRQRLLGDGPPLYAGYVAWQAIIELKHDPTPGASGFFTFGRGGRFGLLKLGRSRHYWFATKRRPEARSGGRISAKAELLKLFGSWHAPISDVIGVTPENAIHRDGIYYREPLGERWGAGPLTLLGDAAHPMTPDLGQGACQAIEDAVVLARFLKEPMAVGGAEARLRLYEASRAERVAYVVRRSRAQGRLLQLGGPLLWRIRNAAFGALPDRVLLDAQLRSLGPVAGHKL